MTRVKRFTFRFAFTRPPIIIGQQLLLASRVHASVGLPSFPATWCPCVRPRNINTAVSTPVARGELAILLTYGKKIYIRH